MQIHKKLLDVLKSKNKFIITSHVNPDPDAIGSELAIADILKQLGKEYFILNTSSTPYNLKFLDIDNQIQKYNEEEHKTNFESVDSAIVLDLNSLNRTVRMEEKFRKFEGEKICIDHHTYPEDFYDFGLINETKSSTGEVLFDFINSCKELEFNENIALNLYSAIMTDTGSFRYSKTTPELHKKVAKLLSFNLNPEEIYNEIYAQYKFSRVKTLGKSLSTIEITKSEKVSYLIVTQAQLKEANAEESEVDGFVNFALTTKGVQIGILFFELKDGVKISFRSKGKTPVNLLAQEFGGGGHTNAAGTRLYNISLDEIIPKVLESAEKLLVS